MAFDLIELYDKLS